MEGCSEVHDGCWSCKDAKFAFAFVKASLIELSKALKTWEEFRFDGKGLSGFV